MFVVTFHGGTGGTSQLYSYKDDGSGGAPYLTSGTPSGTTGLRDVKFQPPASGGLFYLVNSYKEASEVLQIAPDGTGVTFVTGVGSGGPALASVYHPFGLAFDNGLDVLYISNQDSNVVVRVYGPKNTSAGAVPGQPMPVNPALVSLATNPTYLPGTFVASQVALAPLPTTMTSAQGGLGASSGAKLKIVTPSNSVRGVAVIGTVLYVADEVDNLIRQYDTTDGTYSGSISDPDTLVQGPVHLIANGGLLYITVTSATETSPLVLQYDSGAGTLSAVVTRSKTALDLTHPSGMTFDGSGNFYLADLKEQQVYQFNSGFTLTGDPFISSKNMPDGPEFILWVNDDWLQSGNADAVRTPR